MFLYIFNENLTISPKPNKVQVKQEVKMSERLIDANQQTPVQPTPETAVPTYDHLDVFLNSSMDGCPNMGAEIKVGEPVIKIRETIAPQNSQPLK